MAVIEKHPEKRFGYRVRVMIKITQYHKHDVSWLLDATGVGGLRSNRRTFEWVIRDQLSAAWLVTALLPYLRSKKKQAHIALEILGRKILHQKDLCDVAQLADTLSGFNVRSRNRRKNFAAMIKENGSRND